MDFFHPDCEMQNTTDQLQLPDVEDLPLFDIESVWCSFCQRPRLDDGLSTDLCICVSFTSISSTVTNNDLWLPQAVDTNAFQNLQPQIQLRQRYNAVDTWLHGSAVSEDDAFSNSNLRIGADAREGKLGSVFDSMLGISPTVMSLGLYSLSTSANDVSSPATTSIITPMTRGSSVTSTAPSSLTPSRERGRESERTSLEMDSSDSSEFKTMLNTKQRRREQDRNSQHRFRERRNRVTRDLKEKVEDLTRINEILNREIEMLKEKLGACASGSEVVV